MPTHRLMHPLFAPMLAAASALGGAWISQYLFGTHPCQLCIWQRYPYGAILALGMIAWLLRRRGLLRPLVVLAGLLFLTTSGIGWYHVGVEQGWVDAPAGCAVSVSATASLEELKAQIMAAPLVSCKDVGASFLGLSMPVWNALYGLMCAVGCVIIYHRVTKVG